MLLEGNFKVLLSIFVLTPCSVRV